MVSPLHAMKAYGGCECKGPHIGYSAPALGRDRVASPTVGCIYPRRKPPVLIL